MASNKDKGLLLMLHDSGLRNKISQRLTDAAG